MIFLVGPNRYNLQTIMPQFIQSNVFIRPIYIFFKKKLNLYIFIFYLVQLKILY